MFPTKQQKNGKRKRCKKAVKKEATKSLKKKRAEKKAKGTDKIDFHSDKLGENQVFFVSPGQLHQVMEETKSTGFSMVISSQFLNENSIHLSFIDNLNLFRNYGGFPTIGFAHQLQVSDEDVETMMRLKGEINNIDYSSLEGYITFIQEKVKEKQGEDIIHWTAKQSYLALSSALIACAELKIDATPMEGLGASALLAIEYRHEKDHSQYGKKVRKASSNLFSVV